MRIGVIPGRRAVAALAAGAAGTSLALALGVGTTIVAAAAAGWAATLAILCSIDCLRTARAWRNASPRMTRTVPPSFAIGVRRAVRLAFEADGPYSWRCEVCDHMDASLIVDRPVLRVTFGRGRADAAYEVIPTRRGAVEFAPAAVRVRSRWGLAELIDRLGPFETRRVGPDLAHITRYAWLAGDRRLQEIGIRNYLRRGEGTDFDQLGEYRIGHPVRHIDWKATLRLDRPIVRELQDERDQRVILLIDCGRRMRAEDRGAAGIGTAHFDQVLNAVMLLSYVALSYGDAVGAMTFGTPAEAERRFAPRKGLHALQALLAELHDVQPTAAHSDCVIAAQELLRSHRRRSLVILITNFRDEDGGELEHALRLLRSRHLVLLASLRERILRELATQPLGTAEAAIEVASALWYEQTRRDAFRRIAARDAMMVDAEPERLGIELVNRYRAAKRAGLI